MELTKHESSALRRLRDRQKRWRWLRYAVVGYGVISLSVSTYFIFDSLHSLSEIVTGAKAMPESTLFLASITTVSHIEHLAIACFSLLLVVWGVANWAGDPRDTLLLHLFRQATDGDEKGEKP